jgi:hypothetical protein
MRKPNAVPLNTSPLRNCAEVQSNWLDQSKTLKGAVGIDAAEGFSTVAGVPALPVQNVNLLVDPSTWNMTAS